MRSIRPIATLLLLFLAQSAFAWGGDGHQVVALIAEDRLTPQAQKMIHDLLDGADISDAEIANWADEIKRQRRKTAPWHYVNIPLDATAYNDKRDGNKGNNVITKIDDFEKVLADKTKSKEERAEALKFLTHLIGDLHQPLHCVDRDDRGGNSRLVFFLDQPKAVNLHSVWDSALMREDKGKMRIADYAKELSEQIDPNEAKEWAAGTPADWANEAIKIAKFVCYAGVPADGDPPKLDRKYVNAGIIGVRRRLQKAGVRLADVLNRIANGK